MGKHDSSLTRVQPVLNALIDCAPDGGWLRELCEMAGTTRPANEFTIPEKIGLLASEPDRAKRLGSVFERIVPPPTAFLKWLLEHPDRMRVVDAKTFGAKDPDAQEWRSQLFSPEQALRDEATAEGLKRLAIVGAGRSRHAWWAFEGFSHVDCCLETDRFVLFIEGKRTETLSASTRWFPERSQLWRNVEAARDFAGNREFAVLLAVEDEQRGREAMHHAEKSLAGGFQHLSAIDRDELGRHFLGFVIWSDVVRRFELPPDCLIDVVPTQPRREEQDDV